MSTQKMSSTTSKSIFYLALAVAALLTIPLIAMQFTQEVQWTGLDFVVAGGLLLGFGFLYILGVRRIQSVRYRVVATFGFVATLFLVWAELSVGIFY